MLSQNAESQRRLDQFVDAAFGFAVTLLVISSAQPDSLDDLRSALPNIPASAGAFVSIVLFWQSHKMFARLTPQRDLSTLYLSLGIVFTVLVYVFPLKLLMQTLFSWLSGGLLPGRHLIRELADLGTLYQVYGVGFAVLSGLYVALFARSVALTSEPELQVEARSWRDSWAICAVCGVTSAALALMPLGQAPWLPPMIYCLIPLAIWVRDMVVARASRARLVPADDGAEA